MQLFPCGGAFHGQHRAADLHIGGGQLQQDVQPGDRPGDGVIVAFPPFRRRFLRPGGDALGADAQLGEDFFQPLRALAQAIQQGNARFRAGDGQRHAGKSRAAAHVDDLLSP